jgi:hypothetical protein
LNQEAIVERQSLHNARASGRDTEITAVDSVGNKVLMMSRGNRRLARRGIARLNTMNEDRSVVIVMARRMVLAARMMRFSEIVRHGRAQGTVHAR